MSNSNRLFRISDAVLLQFGETVIQTIPKDINDFSSFDTTITESYPATIQGAKAEVMAINTDQVIIDEMAELTQKVNTALAECNKTYRTIKFFVRKAFTGNLALQNKFGLNDIAKIKSNVPKMVVFFNDIASVASAYKLNLIEAGCNEAVIDSLPQLKDNLLNTDTKQEQFKKERGVITSNRISKLNDLYNLLVPISDIAHIIYADDEAKLAQYALPRPQSSTNSNDDLIVS